VRDGAGQVNSDDQSDLVQFHPGSGGNNLRPLSRGRTQPPQGDRAIQARSEHPSALSRSLELFHKDEIVSEESSWIFRVTPYLVFVTPIFVTLLIPVLTVYPLFFAFMADMVSAGFFLALRGFFAALAAVDTANPYGPMGASRTRMVGFLAEPVFIIVFFTVSFVAGSTIPYIIQKQWVISPAHFFEPSHVLLIAAFLMLILAEAGRIPVDSSSGHFELAMIEESKALEYSGHGAALMKWGGHMKLFVLMCVFLNVLVSPWGLARSHRSADSSAAPQSLPQASSWAGLPSQALRRLPCSPDDVYCA
jgi:formate hydrogenlyase subunit 4